LDQQMGPETSEAGGQMSRRCKMAGAGLGLRRRPVPTPWNPAPPPTSWRGSATGRRPIDLAGAGQGFGVA